VIALLLLLATIAGLLIWPGWRWANKREPQSYWICFLPAGGLCLWVLLTAIGFGAQSMANVVETFVVALLSVVVAYLNFFVGDRQLVSRAVRDGVAVATVVVIVTLLRAFTPVLAE